MLVSHSEGFFVLVNPLVGGPLFKVVVSCLWNIITAPFHVWSKSSQSRMWGFALSWPQGFHLIWLTWLICYTVVCLDWFDASFSSAGDLRYISNKCSSTGLCWKSNKDLGTDSSMQFTQIVQHHVISMTISVFPVMLWRYSYACGFVGTLVQTEGSVLGQSSQVQPASKPNASPRPSILRKRDNEGWD